jgi:Leucine-rich repeat (LRR) protein
MITINYTTNTSMSVEILNRKYDINLRELDLSSNQLKSLPDSIGDLINLEKLDLSSNQLECLPDSFGNLINLQILALSYNQLKSLPDSIGNLINLRKLGLSHNQLESLPDSIGNLINLKGLWLQKNKLKSLPTSILKIKEVLCIHDTSYQINNLNAETQILIFSELNNKLQNLPTSLTEIWIRKGNLHIEHKLPFNCELKYY